MKRGKSVTCSKITFMVSVIIKKIFYILFELCTNIERKYFEAVLVGKFHVVKHSSFLKEIHRFKDFHIHESWNELKINDIIEYKFIYHIYVNKFMN